MTRRKLGLVAVLGLASLAACGQSHDGHGNHDKDNPEMADHSGHDMKDHDMKTAPDAMIPVNGKVVQVFADAGRIKIDHEEIPAINMAAMTMSFQAGGDVDLVRFSEEDAVHFMLKQGRDGSFRIMQMCKTDGSDDECMSNMKH